MAKKNINRVLSLVIALTLIIGIFPTNVFAAPGGMFGWDDFWPNYGPGSNNHHGTKSLYWCYDSANTNGKASTDAGLVSVTFNGSAWAFGTSQTFTSSDSADIVITPVEGYRVTKIEMLCVLPTYSRDPYDCVTYNEGATYIVSPTAGSTSVSATEFTVASACNHESGASTYYVMVTVEKITAVTPEEPTPNPDPNPNPEPDPDPDEPQQPVYFEVTYSAGEGEGEDHKVSQLEFADIHEVLAINDNALGFTAPANHEFSHWLVTECTDKVELYDISGESFNPGDEISMPAGNVTLTAQWKEIEAPQPVTFSLTVNYVDENGKALKESEVSTVTDGASYETNAAVIENYELIQTEGATSGTVASDIVVTYIYRYIPKTFSLTVNYVDESGKALKASDLSAVTEGASYETNAAVIEQYEFVKTEGTTSGTVASDIVVTYIYRYIPKTFSLTVNYVDESGKTLKASDVSTVTEGASYETNAAVIENYELVKTEGTTSGTVASDIVVTYIYRYIPKTFSLTVNYVDENGKTLKASDVSTVTEGASYETNAAVIENYELIQTEGATSGTVANDVVVTYVYKRILERFDLTVNYVDENGNAIRPSDVQTGILEGTEYETIPAEIQKYELVKTEGETKGVIESDVVVTYTYRNVPTYYTLTINYITHSGEVLKDADTVTLVENSEYSTLAAEIDGYYLIEIEGEEEGILTDDVSVYYYYDVVISDIIEEPTPEEPTPEEPTPEEPTPEEPTPEEPTPEEPTPEEPTPEEPTPEEPTPEEPGNDEPIDIPDDDVPTTDIPDEEVPLTGDNSYVFAVVTIFSAIALAVLVFRKKEEA